MKKVIHNHIIIGIPYSPCKVAVLKSVFYPSAVIMCYVGIEYIYIYVYIYYYLGTSYVCIICVLSTRY